MMRLRSSAPPTKPFIALAVLSFMLTLSHYSSVNPSVNQPQLSIKKATVEQSLDAESQFDAPESDRNAGTAAVLSVGIVVVGILSLMKGKNSFKPSSTAPRSSSRHSPKSQENTIRLGSFNRELENKLLRLLHGDRQLAIRLLSQVKMKNPGRSTNWYVEKVIYDLERDHGRW
jgi:hypothetical protein